MGDPFGICVDWCCNFDGVVEPEERCVGSSRGVGSAVRDTGGRIERWCSGVADPGARSGEGDSLRAGVEPVRGADRIAEQSVDVLLPQVRQEIVESTQLVIVERIRDQVGEQMGVVFVPHETVELIQLVLVECIKDRIAGQIVDIPVHSVTERDSCEGGGLVPQERVQRIEEQTVEVLAPQIMKEIVEATKIVPQEQFSEGSGNSSWTSPFHKLTCRKLRTRLKLFSFWSNKGTGGMESSVGLFQTAHPSVRMHSPFCLQLVGL